MEWVLEGKCVALSGALDFDGEGSDDGLIGSPGVGYESGGVEESWSDDIALEVLFDSSFLHGPSYDFDVGVSVIPKLYLMEAIAAPVVALSNISVIEIEMYVVMFSKVVCRINLRGSEKLSHLK